MSNAQTLLLSTSAVRKLLGVKSDNLQKYLDALGMTPVCVTGSAKKHERWSRLELEEKLRNWSSIKAHKDANCPAVIDAGRTRAPRTEFAREIVQKEVETNA